MLPYLIYIGLSLSIGILGIHRKFGFWGYFFASLVLTPIIGLILLLASGKREAVKSGE
ncbi:MAG: hypothetical protein QF876_00430 [Desulfobacterales bacterium]|jgi:hypothetical protein|nr:hypothetical protein [Desulfobacterales bacterium]MDP6808727.1 hypothetical protein [Desulfobacterales bacterium]